MSVARLGQVQPNRTLVRVRGHELLFASMPALALATTRSPAPAPPAGAPARGPGGPRRRVPSARALALYALGLVAGFLLAGLASLPGGAEVVSGQLGLAHRRRGRRVWRRCAPAPWPAAGPPRP